MELKNQKNQKDKINKIKLMECQRNKYDFNKDAPTFLDTHNNLQYRNWGTGTVMPSMKPSPKAATTDLPFKANSVYRS